MLRKGRESGAAEVLLVRRAKPPEQGKWTVPGGSLELGETMVECAVREAYEETGVRLRNDPQAGDCGSMQTVLRHTLVCSTALRRTSCISKYAAAESMT